MRVRCRACSSLTVYGALRSNHGLYTGEVVLEVEPESDTGQCRWMMSPSRRCLVSQRTRSYRACYIHKEVWRRMSITPW